MRNISDLPLGWIPFPPRISVRFPEARPVRGRALNGVPHSPVEEILFDYKINLFEADMEKIWPIKHKQKYICYN